MMLKINNRYLHLVILVITEFAYCYFSVILSQLIIFLYWGSGEGANQDLIFQNAIWMLLFLAPATLVNLIGFIRNRKKNALNKATNYVAAEIIVIVFFLAVLSYYGYY